MRRCKPVYVYISLQFMKDEQRPIDGLSGVDLHSIYRCCHRFSDFASHFMPEQAVEKVQNRCWKRVAKDKLGEEEVRIWDEAWKKEASTPSSIDECRTSFPEKWGDVWRSVVI